MPRLFVGNFEFEHCLANAGYRANTAIARLNAELAVSWLAVAEEGDLIWCPEPIAPGFFADLQAMGLPRVVPVTNLANVSAEIELVPWGWTENWIRRARERGWSCAAPDSTVVRELNSRRFSHELELQRGVGIPGSAAVTEAGQIDEALSAACNVSSAVVIKANWGMSGRERLIVHGPLTESQLTWLRKRLVEQGVVVIEPWVELVEEIGIQLEIPRQGPPTLVGTAVLMCDRAGHYRGNWCTDPPGAGEEFHQRWQPAIDAALSAAMQMQQFGYFGPAGIDAARFLRPDGSIGLRPLQDINARWTMGRLSLGWRRLLRSGERACWQHGTAFDAKASLAAGVPPIRVIDTSPAEVIGRPVNHRSRLCIYAV